MVGSDPSEGLRCTGTGQFLIILSVWLSHECPWSLIASIRAPPRVCFGSLLVSELVGGKLFCSGLRVAYAHTNQYLEHVCAPVTTPDGYTLICGLDRLARRHKPILKPIWAHYAVRPGRL